MIVFAEEINKIVYVYDEHKKLVFSKHGILHNYSDNFIAIKRCDSSNIIDVFDSTGKRVYNSAELIDVSDLIKNII